MSIQSRKAARAIAASAAVATASLLVPRPALAQVVFDQGDLNTSQATNITSQLVADDFQLLAPSDLTHATVFLADDDVNNDGQLTSFSGRLGWGLFRNNTLTQIEPGVLVASGSATPDLTDTGLQDADGADIFAARFPVSLPGPLQPGLYWLAIQEGDWLSLPPLNATPVWWVGAQPAPFGAGEENLFSVADTILVPNLTWIAGTGHTAFILENVIPEPLAAAPVAALLLALSRRRRT